LLRLCPLIDVGAINQSLTHKARSQRQFDG
jgi:hypothetical protein